MTIREFYTALEQRLPRSLSWDWDNDGISCAPDLDAPVTGVLIALDPTEDAVEAAIEAGAAADIAVFDLTEKFTVDPDQFVSKGKSSPFTGMELYGVTELTVCAGKIVYRRK